MSSRPESMQAPDQDSHAGRRRPPGIATHYLRYSTSNAIVLLANFISFPILTRLLDNTQFGILRYYETWMMIGVAVVKLGAQHAIQRFYPYDGDPRRMREFGTNLVLLPLVLSALLWALGALGLTLWHWWGGAQVSAVMWCAVLMTPMLAASSIVQMVVRASERSDIVMATRVVARWLELVLVLGAVILVQRSALAVFGGKMIATILLLAWFLHWMYRNVRVARDAVDFGAVRNSLRFGVPMMANELAGMILTSVDRLLLKDITGDFAAVGIYTIGYSLAMQINVFIDATLSDAFTPVVNRSYETGGSRAVRALKERVLLPMTYAVVAICAMVLVAGRELLVALSGPDKAASGDVFVVVGITLSLLALFNIANYGLLLKNRSTLYLAITVSAALLNVVINLMLIPRMGYMGAAWATAISYAVLCVARFVACPRDLASFPGARAIILSLACAAVLVAVARGTDLFGVEGAWMRLVVAGGLFCVLYALPVLVLDRDLRRVLPTLRRQAR